MDILAFSIETVRDWVNNQGFEGGVLLVFLLLFSCGVGFPMPEDIPLIISGALLCTTPQRWVIVGIACWCGIIGGDCVLYYLGRRYGLGIQKVPIIGKHVSVERVGKAQEWFHRYGVWVVAVGRMLAGVRGVMVFTAGTIRYPFATFIVADGLGAIVSGGFFMVLGHYVGSKLDDKVIHEFKEYFIGGAVVLMLAVVIWVLWKRRTHKTLSEVVVEKVTHHQTEGKP